jgi:glycosyltransferase involved in cell wall biosynthesis
MRTNRILNIILSNNLETMKAVHLTSVHNRYDTRIFQKECKSLLAAGFDVYLIVADSLGDEVADNITILDVGREKNRIKRMIYSVNKVYKKALSLDAEVYHIHDPELLRIAVKLKKKGKKVIYDAHEDLPRQLKSKHYIPKYLRSLLAFLTEYYEDNKVKKLDFIVTATDFIKQRFLKINSAAESINNYPFRSEFVSDKSSSAEKEKQIIYVGAISRIRGILSLIESLDNTNVQLVLGGNFEDDALYEKCKKLAGWEKVKYLGYMNREQMNIELNKSIAGCVTFMPEPNHINAQPNKLFEYMAAGIPVIASNFPLWKQIIENNKCGICVDPSSASEIGKVINNLAGDPELCYEMGRNGKEAVQQKYNWENEETRFLNVYKKVLE